MMPSIDKRHLNLQLNYRKNPKRRTRFDDANTERPNCIKINQKFRKPIIFILCFHKYQTFTLCAHTFNHRIWPFLTASDRVKCRGLWILWMMSMSTLLFSCQWQSSDILESAIHVVFFLFIGPILCISRHTTIAIVSPEEKKKKEKPWLHFKAYLCIFAHNYIYVKILVGVCTSYQNPLYLPHLQ